MVGNVEVTKKITLELTEQEFNSIVLAVGTISPARLAEQAGLYNLTVVPVLAGALGLDKLYMTLKALAGLK